MDENDFEIEKKYENPDKDMIEENPTGVYGRNQITYYNPKKKVNQTQNFLVMNDLVVPVMVKRDETGKLYFAMAYTYLPAKNRIFLELPAIGLGNEKKDSYPIEDIEKATEKLIESLGLEPFYEDEEDKEKIRLNELSSKSEPVSQSFTDQTAKFVEVGVKEKDVDQRLHWFSVDSLQDLLSQSVGMSVQTKYALLLFAQKHKEELEKCNPTKAEVDEKLLYMQFSQDKEDLKEIWPHKHRFGVEEQEDLPKKIKRFIEENKVFVYDDQSVYGKSRDSVQCVITRIKDGRVQVGLSKQQRSPFIYREEIDEYLTEISAGMIEKKDEVNARTRQDVVENATRRESREEGGIILKDKYLKKLAPDLLLSLGTEEISKFYLAELPEVYGYKKQKLDEQENIEEVEWFDLEELDIDGLNSPLPTKIALLMARNYYEKEIEKDER